MKPIMECPLMGYHGRFHENDLSKTCAVSTYSEGWNYSSNARTHHQMRATQASQSTPSEFEVSDPKFIRVTDVSSLPLEGHT